MLQPHLNGAFRDRWYLAIREIVTQHAVIDPKACFEIAAPLDRMHGKETIIEQFYLPLRQALEGVHRRDLLCIGGQNTQKQGGYWLACLTHYVGNFHRSLWGISPSHHVVFLRSGEFYRIENDRIVQAYILLDLPDLLRQIGKPLFPHNLGNEITFPAPATQDGILPQAHASQAAKTLGIMEGMFSDLHQFDPNDFSSKNQTGDDGYWHPDMLWYGPSGVGSNYRWNGFVQDHRQSFLRAFPDRKGGNHYCRLADGHYSAASGWPSMHMHFQHAYLGIPADGRKLTLRVMDFYRCDNRQICENWVCLDYLDLIRQMGIDIHDAIASGKTA